MPYGRDIQVNPGDIFGNAPIVLNNRTGATTVQGSTGFIDTPQADADSTSLATGMSNVVAVSTALITKGILVVAKDAGVVDNAAGNYYCGEGVQCYINVDGTTDVAKGDILKPVNAGDHMVKATAGTDRWYAVSLEARTTDSEGPVLCLLFSSGRF